MSQDVQDEDGDSLECVEDGEDPGEGDGGLTHDEETKQPHHPQQRQQDERRLDNRPEQTQLTQFCVLVLVFCLYLIHIFLLD